MCLLVGNPCVILLPRSIKVWSIGNGNFINLWEDTWNTPIDDDHRNMCLKDAYINNAWHMDFF